MDTTSSFTYRHKIITEFMLIEVENYRLFAIYQTPVAGFSCSDRKIKSLIAMSVWCLASMKQIAAP